MFLGVHWGRGGKLLLLFEVIVKLFSEAVVTYWRRGPGGTWTFHHGEFRRIGWTNDFQELF